MSRECVSFAWHLIDSKFQVYLPLFYGDPGKSSNILNPLQVCISREFVLFTGGKSSPVTDWLRALCAKVSHDNHNSKIGVIGMCLTGSFVLACVAVPGVAAAVMSQPALPLHIPFCKDNGSQIGASASEMATAKALQTPILALRFKADKHCPQERFDALALGIGPCWTSILVEPPAENPKAHSVLTQEWMHHPTRDINSAVEQVVGFLQQKLN
jgi:dienelactone hydrolase